MLLTNQSGPGKFDPLRVQCPSEGSPATAKYILIGEAPGVTECATQRPFSGQAGKILDLILNAAGIPRTQCYITNVTKAKLPQNDTKFLWTRKGYRHEAWEELKRNLTEEISQCKAAKVLVLLGETPLAMLTGELSITNWRGTCWTAKQSLPDPLASWLAHSPDTRAVLATSHPARCLPNREPNAKWVILKDLQKAQYVATNGLPDDAITIHTQPNYDTAMDFLGDIISGNLTTSFDIELRNLQVSCIAFTRGTYRDVMCIPFFGPSGLVYSEVEERLLWERMSRLLYSEAIPKLAQNGMFDMTFLLRTMGIKTNNLAFDSMLAHHLCYAELPKGLDFLTSVYTYHPYYKDEGKDWRDVQNYQRFWEYNGKDAAYVHEMMPTILAEVDALNQRPTLDFLMQLHAPLIEMQYRGIRTDRYGLANFGVQLEKSLAENQEKLNAIAGKPLNPNSPKQLAEYFYVDRGYTPYYNRKTKALTTDDTALKRLSRKGSKVAVIVKAMRATRKLLGTYISIPIDSDDRLRCSYNIAGTETGRLSSSATLFGTGTNLQNQPKAVKPYYEADPGYVLIEYDLKQAEAVVVAYISGDEQMIKGFESGLDVHTFNASNIFNVPFDQVTKEQRTLGKKVVHASNYDMGYKTFSLNVEIPEKEAKALLTAYHHRYPGLHKWHASVRDTVFATRKLTNLFGRTRLFLGLINDATYKAAYAYVPQSTVAEYLNRMMVAMWLDTWYIENDIQFLATVHDSILLQAPCCCDFHELFTRTNNHSIIFLKGKHSREFTIGLDAKMGYNWGDCTELKDFSPTSINAALAYLHI